MHVKCILALLLFFSYNVLKNEFVFHYNTIYFM